MKTTVTTKTMDTYIHEIQVRNNGLDLADDLRLRSCVEGLQFHVENRLFFWFLLLISIKG